MIFIALVLVISHTIESSVSSNATQRNYFEENYLIVHNLSNHLFKMLKLNHKFPESDHNVMLVMMHNALENRAQHNLHVCLNSLNKTITHFEPAMNYKFKNESISHILSVYFKSLFNSTKNNINMELIRHEYEDFFDNKLRKKSNVEVEATSSSVEMDVDQNDLSTRIVYLNDTLRTWEVGSNASSKCNESASSRRIYNGEVVAIEEYPFMVSIHVLGRFVCGGSLISHDLVITAATCLEGAYNDRRQNFPISIMVRLGSDYTDKNGILVPVVETFLHPQYNRSSLYNNLVILKLSSRRNIKGTKYIAKIKFDTRPVKIYDKLGGVAILGWGDKSKNETYTENSELSFDLVKVYPFESCRKIYSRFYVSDASFCAGFVKRPSGACNKDAGSPGVLRHTLMGVVSFGPPSCGAINAPTVFTKLGFYAEWIRSIINR